MKRVIAFTGSHGTGKTTSAMQESVDQKKFNPDADIELIYNLEKKVKPLYPINQRTSEKAQLCIFSQQMQTELATLAECDILVTDRTVVDIIAYTFVAGFQELGMGMLGLAEQHMALYDEIHFKQIEHNPYCFDDGVRAVNDDRFRKLVEFTLKDLYSQLEREGYVKQAVWYD